MSSAEKVNRPLPSPEHMRPLSPLPPEQRDRWGRLPYAEHLPAPRRDGLYEKFKVRRADGIEGPGTRHDGCQYFVLDLSHDKYGITAALAYADACQAERPLLAEQLRQLCAQEEERRVQRHGRPECC